MAEASENVLSDEAKHLPFLVVEYDEALQKSMVAALSAAGVKNCGVAADGGEAWGIWRKNRDLGVVICAWNLAEMSGLDFLRRVRTDSMARVQPAFIMVATKDEPDAAQQAVTAGADGFLEKPFPPTALLPMVNEGLAHRRQVSGGAGLSEQALESRILGSRPSVELIFERYTTTVECDELSNKKCVLRVSNNYGLGTVLNMRFPRATHSAEQLFYQPLRGIVTKIERIPKEYGMFRLHLEFRGTVRDQHGVRELLATGDFQEQEE